MTVDLEAIARRGRCEESNLRIALPLIEQGYAPPFLARYRRDELGGLEEGTLWELSEALHAEKALAHRRAELLTQWTATPLADPALGRAIEKASTKRMLERLGRRIKLESNEAVDGGTKLAVRILNPEKGDGDDFQTLAQSAEGITDTEEAIGHLEESLARRLAGDPRIINAAVQWLSKHARILVAEISDPHVSGNQETDNSSNKNEESAGDKPGAEEHAKAKDKPGEEAVTPAEPESPAEPENVTAENAELAATETAGGEEPAATETVATAPAAAEPVASEEPAAPETVATDPTASETTEGEAPTAAQPATAESAAT
ncbi:Tex-like N-terminal domain-containing protein, partial [Novipirellula herctigrandis]|uniref:Tex-like N-terminal domain-containing protein n=1 Tax=Novipirellula herctigrandis TaxID=2527986 RepID=UPI003AF36066